MKKILVIVGPTAVGKTELALEMANKFNGELVSADSRQVYKELDIGTGKDLPTNSKFEFVNSELGGYYSFGNTRLWGYDLADPKEEFSVAQYVAHAKRIIKHIWSEGKLPIIVGGTGFYVRALIDGVDTLDIPQNKPLRHQLENMQIGDLFEILAQLDAAKAASLNSSDRKNKVRLIRAIEIADARIRGIKQRGAISPIQADIFLIGLMADKETIKHRVEKRVIKRIEMGVEDEIKSLLENGVMWQDQSMSSLGYKQWKDYFERGGDKEKVISDWIKDETKYVKRQLTWFKKDKRIYWVNRNFVSEVEQLVEKWYSSNKDESSKD